MLQEAAFQERVSSPLYDAGKPKAGLFSVFV